VITLGTGTVKSGLAISQDDLTLQGPAGALVTITGEHPVADGTSNAPAHIIDHLGSGTLSVNNLTLVSGRPSDSAKSSRGGCIFSKGTVSLSHSAVCGATILASAVAARSASTANGDISPDDIATPEHPYLRSPPGDGN